jgi:hypothetical protein
MDKHKELLDPEEILINPEAMSTICKPFEGQFHNKSTTSKFSNRVSMHKHIKETRVRGPRL